MVDVACRSVSLRSLSPYSAQNRKLVEHPLWSLSTVVRKGAKNPTSPVHWKFAPVYHPLSISSCETRMGWRSSTTWGGRKRNRKHNWMIRRVVRNQRFKRRMASKRLENKPSKTQSNCRRQSCWRVEETKNFDIPSNPHREIHDECRRTLSRRSRRRREECCLIWDPPPQRRIGEDWKRGRARNRLDARSGPTSPTAS